MCVLLLVFQHRGGLCWFRCLDGLGNLHAGARLLPEDVLWFGCLGHTHWSHLCYCILVSLCVKVPILCYLNVLNVVLESPTIGLHISKVKRKKPLFQIIYIVHPLIT